MEDNKERYVFNPLPPKGGNIELMEGGRVYILKAGETYKSLPDKIIEIALGRYGFLKEISGRKAAEQAVEAETRLPTIEEAPGFKQPAEEKAGDTTESVQAGIDSQVSGPEFYGKGLEDDTAS